MSSIEFDGPYAASCGSAALKSQSLWSVHARLLAANLKMLLSVR